MNETQLWEKALSDLELEIPRPNFLTWLKNSQIVEMTDGGVKVGLASRFAQSWVEKHYPIIILKALRNLNDSIKRVEFTVITKNINRSQLPKVETRLDDYQQTFEPATDPETSLNPKYTLKSYAVGSSNEMAFAAINAIIENVGKKYNPLLIYGGVGVGKTHLIQAAGNEIKNRYGTKCKIRYVHAEKFINDVVHAMRTQNMHTVKSRYRDINVLIIDDIQFIAGKAKTEEEFFYTFNTLKEDNKQIIISSDRPPKSMPNLEERLRSRLDSGMIIDISPPDYELRIAVLKNKLEEKNLSLDPVIISEIATKAEKSLRDLEGIVNKIQFYKDHKKAEITSKVINEIIGNSSLQKINKLANPNEIIKIVSNYFEITTQDIIGRSRKQEIVEPRQIAIFLLRDILNMSYPAIAGKLGKRDHTTAIYAYDKIKKEIEQNQSLNQKIISIKDLIESSC